MNENKFNIIKGVFYPVLFVALLWLIKFIEEFYGLSFVKYAIRPRIFSGLIGIPLSPLVHGDWYHLYSNSIPLLILGSIIFYFYRPIAFHVFFWVYLMTGIWVWAAAREAYHVGASGLIYGFVTFLFFSGIFRKDRRLLALSMLVAFIYGGLVWGVFPLMPQISWESHLLGSLAGIITAYHYRNEGPEPIHYDWEKEEDKPAAEGEDEYWKEEK